MARNNRILIKIVRPWIIVIIAIAAIFIFTNIRINSRIPSWQKFPCYRPGYPDRNVLLINGKKYDLPIFKSSDARKIPYNAETVNETVTVEVDKATVDWEIMLAEPTPFRWIFPDKQKCIKTYALKSECYEVRKDMELKGASPPCVLVYNMTLAEAKDTVLHFYYYNCLENKKPVNERHINYHLQIALKFKQPATAN